MIGGDYFLLFEEVFVGKKTKVKIQFLIQKSTTQHSCENFEEFDKNAALD